MTVSDESLTLVVQDDGHGFDEANQQPGNGLSNMRDRMRAVHGQFRIHSSATDGTRLDFELPLTT